MPEQSGSIIDDPVSGGKSAAHTTVNYDNGTKGGNDDPEIIGGFDAIEPDRIKIGTADSNGDDYGGDGNAPKRRGRKPGSKNKPRTTEEKEPLHLAGLDLKDILISIHVMGASFLSMQELCLSPGEAEALAKAIGDVAKYHAVSIDPKKLAYFNLCMVAGTIYGSRFMQIRARNKTTKPKVVPTPIKAEPIFDAQAFHMDSMRGTEAGAL